MMHIELEARNRRAMNNLQLENILTIEDSRVEYKHVLWLGMAKWSGNNVVEGEGWEFRIYICEDFTVKRSIPKKGSFARLQ